MYGIINIANPQKHLRAALHSTVLTWIQLRRLSRSRAVQSAYVWFFLVPLAAKSLSGLEAVVLWTIENERAILLALPFSWEFLFYSSVFMAIGNLTFTVSAPSFIREYSTCAQYLTSEGTEKQLIRDYTNLVIHSYNTTDRSYNDEVLKNVKDFLQDYCENGDHLKSSLDNKDKSITQALTSASISNNQECGAFWHAQRFLSRDKYIFRAIASWSYWLGFITIGIVFAQNIWFVLQMQLCE